MKRRSLVALLQICPVTGGNPTTMTEEDFSARCAVYRKNAARSELVQWCDECGGDKRPQELTIVDKGFFGNVSNNVELQKKIEGLELANKDLADQNMELEEQLERCSDVPAGRFTELTVAGFVYDIEQLHDLGARLLDDLLGVSDAGVTGADIKALFGCVPTREAGHAEN